MALSAEGRGRVEQACMNGQCGLFAYLLSERTGWPALGIHVGPWGLHAVVGHPAGGLVDALGLHPERNAYAAAYVAARGYGSQSWRFEPYTGAPHSTGPQTAPLLDIAALVFDVLDDIGYEHHGQPLALATASLLSRLRPAT